MPERNPIRAVSFGIGCLGRGMDGRADLQRAGDTFRHCNRQAPASELYRIRAYGEGDIYPIIRRHPHTQRPADGDDASG